MSDLKGLWTTRKNNIKFKIRQNINLTSDEKAYLLYMVKSNNLINCLLTGKKFQLNDYYHVNKNKLNGYLKRLFRDFPIKKPFSKTHSYILDGSTQISYKYHNEKLYISIPTLIKRHKVRLPLTDKTMVLKGNVRVVLKGNRIEFHKAIDVKPKPTPNNLSKIAFVSLN